MILAAKYVRRPLMSRRGYGGGGGCVVRTSNCDSATLDRRINGKRQWVTKEKWISYKEVRDVKTVKRLLITCGALFALKFFMLNPIMQLKLDSVQQTAIIITGMLMSCLMIIISIVRD